MPPIIMTIASFFIVSSPHVFSVFAVILADYAANCDNSRGSSYPLSETEPIPRTKPVKRRDPSLSLPSPRMAAN
jgi:hypothetical protein